ncbi:hypothetical protein [Qipengyuania mesophila]|uniref:hypothetical protein n=1 Tax=Qipengyuania mesophila TaxID=2867246 RepID=UPI003511CD63
MFKLLQAKLESWAEKKLIGSEVSWTWSTVSCGYIEDMDGLIRKIELEDFEEPEERRQCGPVVLSATPA